MLTLRHPGRNTTSIHYLQLPPSLPPSAPVLSLSLPCSLSLSTYLPQQFIHPTPTRGPSRFCPHRKGRWPSPPIKGGASGLRS